MPLVKETVDRLMKGYDIRLRPDFGGNDEKKTPSVWFVALLKRSACLKKGKKSKKSASFHSHIHLKRASAMMNTVYLLRRWNS